MVGLVFAPVEFFSCLQIFSGAFVSEFSFVSILSSAGYNSEVIKSLSTAVFVDDDCSE